MKSEEAINQVGKAAKTAKAQGVKVVYFTNSEHVYRPLKTVKGAIDNIRAQARHGFWDGWLVIKYVGKVNGRFYNFAKTAARY